MENPDDRKALLELVDANYRIARDIERMHTKLLKLHEEANELVVRLTALLNRDATPRANTDHEDTSPGRRR